MGGRVGAACTGSAVSLQFATPATGWSFRVESEADHVKVTFASADRPGESEVTARCAGGTPVFDSSSPGDVGGS